MQNPLPEGGEDLTVKHCAPFVDALSLGFVIPLQCDVTVKDGQFTWDWPFAESPMGLHFPTQAPGAPYVDPGQVVLKAHNFWSIHTEPGFSTLFTHPLNRLDLPFRTLSEPEFEGVLPAGTPVAQCVPVRRETLELDIQAMTEAEHEAAKALKQSLKTERGYYKTHMRRQHD
jgi:hypothetical protein